MEYWKPTGFLHPSERGTAMIPRHRHRELEFVSVGPDYNKRVYMPSFASTWSWTASEDGYVIVTQHTSDGNWGSGNSGISINGQTFVGGTGWVQTGWFPVAAGDVVSAWLGAPKRMSLLSLYFAPPRKVKR